ncbi:MAG: class I mannose-6-phosphate isomerase, partial [Planctomycetes bacterium]|nr:class I mannose-6-phosphate isomerase [Planctomycetota bacterium]
MYPLKFKPIYKERIWGGCKLRSYFNKDFPSNINIGESWELADLPNDKSIIANGELAGQTIAEAIAQYPKEITGDANFSGQFPLLLKLLDAEEKLSVQVHPDEQTCRRMGKGEPKTECWYIIAASKGAVIYKGLKKGVTKEQFAKSIADGTAADLLNKVPVKAGECHFIPAGTVHTISANNMIAEIQTPSDTTYRVFDFNRTDAAGNPRQLHIEDALESINFDIDSSELPVTTSGHLVDSKDFKIDKAEQPKNSKISISPGQMKVYIFVDGLGKIFETKTEKTDFAAGDCVLLPADYEGTMQFISNTQ